MRESVEYAAAARTDVGRKRTGNEDNYCVVPEIGLFIVADGMGGHAAGEVASRLAVETIPQTMRRYLDGTEQTLLGAPADGVSREGNYLLSSIRLANRVIFDAASSRPDYEGMGTTLVAVLTRGDRLTLANVGDSRIYRVRDGKIEQVSRDHSLVQEQVDEGILSRVEAQDSALRHLITRALGIKGSVEPEITETAAIGGDTYLLCSDGLSDLVEDDEMLAVIREQPELGAACQQLVDRANFRGGDDNITVVLLQARAERRRSLLGWLRGLFTA